LISARRILERCDALAARVLYRFIENFHPREARHG
jgi:hypothetical protein